MSVTLSENAIDQEFQEVWKRLAQNGHCDSPLGAEYNRVLKEWDRAGRPADVEGFIQVRANIGPVAS